MAGKTRVGLLGCGGIGRMHAERLLALGNPPSAYFDPDQAQAGKFAGEFGGRALPSLEAVLNECDAILVATPPHLHTAQIISAAKAGKHIFTEKPLCLSLDYADSISHALASSRAVFMIGYVLRFFPAFKALHGAYASGILGNLVSIRDSRMAPWKYWESPWLGDPAKSGGITVEFFTHDIDWMTWIGGMPRRVLGRASKEYPGRDALIDDNVWAWLDFPRGTATGEASWTARQPSSRQEINGDKGSAVSENGKAVIIRNGTGEALDTPGEEPFLAQMREFLSCIAEGRKPEAGFAEAQRALAITIAIRESARTGQPVAVSPGA